MSENIKHAYNRLAIGISILVVVVLVSPIIILLVRNAADTIQVNLLKVRLKVFA